METSALANIKRMDWRRSRVTAVCEMTLAKDYIPNTSILDDLRKEQTMAYVQVAISVALVYDHLTTLDLEIELIWKQKMPLVKVLFLIARYLGDIVPISACVFLFGTLPSAIQCRPSGIIQASAGFVVIFSTQAIMQYRVSAMYRHSRRIITILVSGFLLEILAGILITVTGFSSMTKQELVLGHLYLCYSTNIPRWYFVLWVPMIVFETLLLAMALYAAISHAREIKLVKKLAVENSPALSYLLMRDSILFPMIALTIYVINILLWRFSHPFYQQISLSVAEVGSCVLGCRLIINLREAYYQPFTRELEQTRSISTLYFAQAKREDEEDEGAPNIVP